MKITPKEIKLKNGKTLLLKSSDEDDAAKMIDFIAAISAETHFLLATPDEVDRDIESEKSILRNYCSAEDAMMITAYDGDRPVGNVGIAEVGRRKKMKHRSTLGIAVLMEYWGEGLGRILMTTAEAVAKDMGYEQMELGVYSDNKRAAALYHELGYKVIGRIPNAFKLGEDKYSDEILMIKEL